MTGVGASDEAHPRMNLTDDPYYTEGLRLVVFLGTEPHLPGRNRIPAWERPRPAPCTRRMTECSARIRHPGGARAARKVARATTPRRHGTPTQYTEPAKVPTVG